MTRLQRYERHLTTQAAHPRRPEPTYPPVLDAPELFRWLCGQRACFICDSHAVCGHREPAVLRAELVALGLRRDSMAKGPSAGEALLARLRAAEEKAKNDWRDEFDRQFRACQGVLQEAGLATGEDWHLLKPLGVCHRLLYALKAARAKEAPDA